MAADGTHTSPAFTFEDASQIVGVQVLDANSFRRMLVLKGTLGQELEIARAGVRSALRQHRSVQRTARSGPIPDYRLHPEDTRRYVADAVMRVRLVLANIDRRVAS